MHADRDFDRELERLVHQALEPETGPHAVWAESPAARLVAAHDRRRYRRWPVRFLAVAAVLTLGGAALAGFILSRPVTPAAVENGWVAFSLDDQSGIYIVRDGRPARMVIEPVDGATVQCPAISPDGRRIAFGQGFGSVDGGFHEVTLVMADLTDDGRIASPMSVPVAEVTEPPCAIWSPDGRWIAFGVGGRRDATSIETDTVHGLSNAGNLAEEVWLVDTSSRAIRKVTGLAASDIEWSPTNDELAIANGDIVRYDVANDRTESISGPRDVLTVAWAPDGRRLAFETIVETPGTDHVMCLSATKFCRNITWELWVAGVDGRDPRNIEAGYDGMHGIGPVWSPDGTRIVYQRSCVGRRFDCDGEATEAVIVPVAAADTGGATGDPLVIAPPRTDAPNGPDRWYPFSVTWSPDLQQLLYHAWDEDVSVKGMIAVPADGVTPAAMLFQGPVDVKSGTPWLPLQSWGRQPGE